MCVPATGLALRHPDPLQPYNPAAPGMGAEETLALYRWTGEQWTQEGISSTVVTSAHKVTAQVDRFGSFALLARPRSLFLPLLQR